MTNIIELEQVCKDFKGRQVLKEVNLTLQSGRVYGFVGKNGSGKTMLFRVIAGLVHPSSGTIAVNGQVLHKDISAVPNLGLMLENTGLYPEFTGFQNLKFLANINRKINASQIRQAIERVGLEPEDKRIIKKYSLGMRQRILLAQAIMEEPDFLLLDEPGNGLDEAGLELMRALILEEKKKGAMVLMASHNKEDIGLLCDTVYRVREGRITEDKEI